MHLTVNKYTKSVKLIKIQRQLLKFAEIITWIMLYSSILLSCIVIYKKRHTVQNVKAFGSIILSTMRNAMNIIDNSITHLDSVHINNLKYISASEIKQIIDSINLKNHNISAIQELYRNISAIPFVKSIRIKRHLGKGVDINITERKILGMMQDKISGENYYITQDRQAIKQDGKILNNKFILITDSTVEYLNEYVDTHNAISQCAKISNITSEYINIGDRRWNIKLNNGITIMLPVQSKMHDTINYLCKLSASELDFTNDASTIDYIDARINDRIYYRYRESK